MTRPAHQARALPRVDGLFGRADERKGILLEARPPEGEVRKLAFGGVLTFEQLLERTGGNQSEAARISGVERSYLSKLLGKYGVKR